MTRTIPSSVRRALRVLRVLPLLAAFLLTDARAAAQAPVAAVAETGAPAVVHVDVRFQRAGAVGRSKEESVRVERSSSGVVISEEGLVLTNEHLVDEVDDNTSDGEFWIVVTTQAGESYPAVVVERDERTDLALLQLELPEGVTLPAQALGSREAPQVGARLTTLAFPDGEHVYAFQGAAARSSGQVTLRQARLEPGEVLITDTRFHRMLDGGPLLDARGYLVGIYNASHVYVPKRGDDDEEDEEEKEAVVDYAVIVSTAAIRASFQGRIGDLKPNLDAPSGFQPELAIDAIRTISPAVVGIWTDEDNPYPERPSGSDPHGQLTQKELGSGVVIDGVNGVVVTSADIIKASDKNNAFEVRFADGSKHTARLLEREFGKQLAMIRLELPEGVTVPAATIGDWSAAKSGEFVAVVGRPFGAAETLSVGVLGNLDRGNGFFQVASWLHRGHWGGAVVDRNGRLIGVAVEKAAGEREIEETSYLGFAAPITKVLEWFDDEWEANASDAAKASIVADTEKQIASRRTPVTDVVDGAQSSLVNVLISEAEEVEDTSDAFNPFAEPPEPTWNQLGGGSGVIIDESGLAITNWHVVDHAIDRRGDAKPNVQLKVTLPDGRSYIASVLSTSRDDDLALIRLHLDGDETPLLPVELGDSDQLVLGQPVIAIGNALLLSDSVSSGIISCTSIDVMIRGRLREYQGMLMTDAPINGGNSGGALLDMDGRLVGINSAGRTGAGMAIPVNRAREVFSDKLLSAQRLRSAYFGMKLVDDAAGAVIATVDADGPAARAGVLEGDRVLRLDDTVVGGELAFAQLRMNVPANGGAHRLTVEREGEELTLEVIPLSYSVWHVQRIAGIEVEELSYDEHFELVQSASVALHRAYTGLPNAEPSSLMNGVLRVTRSFPMGESDNAFRSGDLLLGMTRLVYDSTTPSRELIKLDDLATLTAHFDPLATRDGSEVECWVLRDGEVRTVDAFVKRAY